MNEKTTRQIEEMKKQTIGVEIEMNSITRDKAAKIAATYFGTGRFQNTASRNGYYTWSAWDEQGREWKFQKDVSLGRHLVRKSELQLRKVTALQRQPIPYAELPCDFYKGNH